VRYRPPKGLFNYLSNGLGSVVQGEGGAPAPGMSKGPPAAILVFGARDGSTKQWTADANNGTVKIFVAHVDRYMYTFTFLFHFLLL
jgi:hypothetical protein